MVANGRAEQKTENAMTIQKHKTDSYAVLFLEGSLDMYTSLDLKRAIEDIQPGPGVIVILDLALVTYMDSSGIGTLIKLLNELNEKNAALFLSGLVPTIEKIFKVAGLNNFFHILTPEERKDKYPVENEA